MNMLGTIAKNDKGENFLSLRFRNEKTGEKNYLFDGEKPLDDFGIDVLKRGVEIIMDTIAGRTPRHPEVASIGNSTELLGGLSSLVESVIDEHVIDVKADNMADMIKEINATGLFNIGTATPTKDGRADPKQIKKFLKRSQNHEITDEENNYNAFLASQQIQWGEMKDKKGLEKTTSMLTKTIKDCKDKSQKKALKLVLKGLVEINN